MKQPDLFTPEEELEMDAVDIHSWLDENEDDLTDQEPIPVWAGFYQPKYRKTK